MQTSKLAVLGLLLCDCALQAQVDTGAVLGTVKDSSGALITGATVTLTSTATSFTTTTKTSTDGTYIFTPVKVGPYRVDAAAAGFQKVTRNNVDVVIQQQTLVDFTLAPGAVNQEVSVTAAPSLLETQRSAVQQVVQSRSINDLPLNGRNATFLAQLSAGVTFMQSDTRGLGATGGFAANGARPGQNNYMLDGIDNNSDIGDLINRTYYVLLPPPDALQEFSVQTNNYSAEFGHSAGAVLNAAVKSGTNRFHGDVFEYLRNDKVDAADFFLNAAGQPKSEFRQNQFGFTFGGPVMLPHYIGKNKTFFFADYQGTRIRQGAPYNVSVPTLAERASGYTNFQDLIAGQSGSRSDALARTIPSGTILDPATTRAVTKGAVDPVTGLIANATGYVRDPFFAAPLQGVTNFTTPGAISLLNIVPANRLDPNAIKLLNLLPQPNSAGLFNNFTDAPVNQEGTNSFDIRIDQNFSDKDTMFGRYSRASTTNVYPGPFPGIADGAPNRPGSGTTDAQNIALSETHIFSPRLVNELRAGYSRLHDVRLQFGGNNLTNIPGQYGIPGVPQVPENGGLPNFTVGGLAGFGSPNFLPSDKWGNTLQATENVSRITGKHSMRAGFEVQDIRFPMLVPPEPRGALAFNGEYTSIVGQTDGSTGRAQLLLSPAAATVPGGVNNVGGANQVQFTTFRPFADYRRIYLAGYVQDDWRITNTFTVNLGLRYDWFGRPAEFYGAEASFRPGLNFQGGEFLISKKFAGEVPPAFISLLNQDGIQFVPTGGSIWENSANRDFGPRIGFAWHPASRLVIRGGYAIFYGGQEDFGLSSYGANNFPFVIQSNFTAPNPQAPITPDNSVGGLDYGLLNVPQSPGNAAVKSRSFTLIGSNPNWKDAATQNFNLTFQYALINSTTVSAGYVGSVSHHLGVAYGANPVTEIVPPSLNVFSYVAYPDFATGGTYNLADGNSNYNALEINVERRFASGLQFLGNYTLSKCLGTARDYLVDTVSGVAAPYLSGYGAQADYAPCSFDTHNIVHFSGQYDLPFGAGRHFLSQGRLANAVLGGWVINWSLTLQDGQPFTIGCPIATTTGLGCNAWGVPGQSPISGPHNVNQWLSPAAFVNPPVATAVGQTDYAPLGGPPGQAVSPGFHRLDSSLFKQFRFAESKVLEFRCEVFNLSNTPDFAAPSFTNFVDTKNFGKITSTRDNPNDPREIQFALKFYF